MFFVFDISTTIDLQLLLAKSSNAKCTLLPPEIVDADKIEIQSAAEYPVSYRRMVSWVGLWIENNGSPRQQHTWSGVNEKEGLQKLFDTLNMFKDFGLIHYNGRKTHLPLLTYRAMKYELIKPVRLSSHDIAYRYSQQNIDLVDTFSNYGASTPPAFEDLTHLIELPKNKPAEKAVTPFFSDEQLQNRERYLQQNVMKIYMLWLRLVYTNGNLKEEFYYNLKERALKKLHQL